MEGLLSLLLYAALFYFMMRFGCGAHMVHGHGGHRERGNSGQAHPSDATDPVCGMEVAADQGYTKMHQGQPYRLCSRACLDKFEASPQQYVAQTGGAS